jgi:uncharacterized protein
MYYQKARAFALQRLQNELPENLYYHSVQHTLDVCRVCKQLAAHENVKGNELTLLLTAAVYHDIGFIEQYQDNEPVAARIVRECLPAFGYTPGQVEVISNIILATRIPQEPHTQLEKIICDADLDYLGREDFFETARKLQQEWAEYGLITSDYEWNEKQVHFLQQHRYFTRSAREKRDKQKQKHLMQIQTLLLSGNGL